MGRHGPWEKKKNNKKKLWGLTATGKRLILKSVVLKTQSNLTKIHKKQLAMQLLDIWLGNVNSLVV